MNSKAPSHGEVVGVSAICCFFGVLTYICFQIPHAGPLVTMIVSFAFGYISGVFGDLWLKYLGPIVTFIGATLSVANKFSLDRGPILFLVVLSVIIFLGAFLGVKRFEHSPRSEQEDEDNGAPREASPKDWKSI